MKFSQLNILAYYVVATATTLTISAYVPSGPALDGYVDVLHWQLMKTREPNFPADANMALENRFVAREVSALEASQTTADTTKSNKEIRTEYTKNAVTNMHIYNPKKNYVVCHTRHTFSFDGTEGTDWGHWRYELGLNRGDTMWYDVYWFGSGTFTRQGDGGYINWAYYGVLISAIQGSDGDKLVFAKP